MVHDVWNVQPLQLKWWVLCLISSCYMSELWFLSSPKGWSPQAKPAQKCRERNTVYIQYLYTHASVLKIQSQRLTSFNHMLLSSKWKGTQVSHLFCLSSCEPICLSLSVNGCASFFVFAFTEIESDSCSVDFSSVKSEVHPDSFNWHRFHTGFAQM